MDSAITIGVDIGGTFTDLVLFDRGCVRVHKIPSTPQDPAQAVVLGVSFLAGDRCAEITVIHGTTVATNTLLEKTGAKTAFVTTRGFEDIIEIGRQNRAKLYDLFWEKERGLVPRPLRMGVKERMDAGGAALVPLCAKEIDRLANAVDKSGAQSVAVCFLHSYANSAHEEAVGREIEKLGVAVSLSSTVSPEFREYERASTTVANAYLVPKVKKYMRSLSSSLGDAKVFIVQSSGGVTTPDKVADEPVRMATSGPAAGVMGAFRIAERMGEKKIITCDMGGTSTDVSLCDGKPAFSTQNSVGGVPLRISSVEISTVGAGGGSIAHINPGDVLKTGPQSAGADPGPACYGKGDLPTVTDANLVLGRIEPGRFLGGRKKLFPQKSLVAIETLMRGSFTPERTAESVIRVVNSSMERLIRVIAADKGVDPREFALFSFGGAAGLHCCELALGTGMEKVIFPRHPAALSALGMLLCDFHKDYGKSCFADSSSGARLISDAFSELENTARAGHPDDDFQIERFVDARYGGQSHELTIPFSRKFAPDFHRRHFQRFGYMMEDRPVETTAVRIRFCVGKSVIEPPEIKPHGDAEIELRQKDIFIGGSYERFNVYERSELGSGFRFEGPALVLEDSSVLMITPEFKCETDRWGNIVAILKD